MSDNHRALQLAMSDLARAYRQIESLEERLAAQSGWAENETEATIRAEERDRIVQALADAVHYGPAIGPEGKATMEDFYDGDWMPSRDIIAIVRGDV